MVRLRWPAFALTLVLAAGGPSAEAPAPVPDAKPLALVGALIRTQTDAGDFVGTVVIRDGKIAAVGRDVKPPPDAQIVDVARHVIVPGLIDARGSVGLNPAAGRESGSGAALQIVDAIDPYSDDWRDAARQGVTAVYAQPSGSLGGAGAVLRVGPAATAEALALRSPAAIQAALGLPPSAAPQQTNPQLAELAQRFGFNLPQQPAGPPPASNSLTRFAQAEQLRGQFDSARRYSENKSARRDAPKDLLVRALKKEIPVRLTVHHEDDIRNALKIAGDFGLRIVWDGVDKPAVLPEEFTALRAPVVLGPLTGGSLPAPVKSLASDGRRWAIGTFGDEPRASAGLRCHAAGAVAAGLSRDAVLRALTADAADILGGGDRLGRIAVGRPADLAVIAGDPLDPSAPVRLTISQGIVTFSGPAREPVPVAATTTPSLPESLPQRFVIRTTRLLQESGEFAPGTIAVENGKFVAQLPSDVNAPVFDLGDAPVTPGLVAGHVAIETETCPDADASYLRAGDMVAPGSGSLRKHRDAGFLTAVAAPASNNVMAGVGTALPTGHTTSAADAALKLVLTGSARDRERYPVSLAGEIEFIEARLRGGPDATRLYVPIGIRSALLAERARALAALRERKLAAWFEAHTRAEVRAALRLISDHNLRGVLLMPRQLDGLVDEIRAAGVGVVIGPLRPSDAELPLRSCAALGEANVPILFAGEPSEMRMTAASLANAGVPRPSVRRALVGLPGAAFGLPPSIGKFAPGESADVVVWNGDPLDLTSRAAVIIAQGQRIAPGGDDEPRKRAAPPAAPTPPNRRTRGAN